MALRGHHRSRALRRRDGLQRLSSDSAKGEWQPVLLRAQTGSLGSDRLLRDVAGHAVQLPTAEESSHRLRSTNPLCAGPDFGIWVQQHKRRASLAEVSGLFYAAVRNFKALADHLSCLLP